MTSSLVGSEMCIRDSTRPTRGTSGQRNNTHRTRRRHPHHTPRGSSQAVSYTHLTLPTICSV
eukprot:9073858-Prorocentrum_lima.AAC.1